MIIIFEVKIFNSPSVSIIDWLKYSKISQVNRDKVTRTLKNVYTQFS